MMNILFIGKRFNTNRDALTEKFGRIYQLPLHLSKEQDIKIKLWLIDYHSSKRIKNTDNNLKIISTPVRTGAVFYQYIKESIEREKYDLVIASGDCYIGLLGYILAISHKAKFIFDVYDKYDEFSGYIKPLGFDLFGFLLKKADMRFFASHTLLQELGQPQYDTILSNGIDAKHFRAIDKTEARTKLQLSLTQTFVGYFGSMESDRGVQDLIDAVKILRQQGHDIVLLLGGRSDPNLDLDQLGIHYLGNVLFRQVPYALAACDVLAIPHRRSAFLDAAAPNKIGEAMMMHRPIVATRSPNLFANFPKQAASLEPYLARPRSPESLASAIAKQLKDGFLVNKPSYMYWNEITLKVKGKINKLLTSQVEL
ncbi:glycosyltransferase family 4 protein [Acinetobacter radioresistens]|uniref:glycosyltransferase family 4 protein n=1 Tax=Acinetobacter radioresistens TaxID=40216 RepID=UPI0032147100